MKTFILLYDIEVISGSLAGNQYFNHQREFPCSAVKEIQAAFTKHVESGTVFKEEFVGYQFKIVGFRIEN